MNATGLSFNRTFMELKSTIVHELQAIHGCFNRTFMELKYRPC